MTDQSFAAEFQRRLRAVLATKLGRAIPEASTVTVEAASSGSDDDTRGVDRALRIVARLPGGGLVDFEYEEPGAWVRLISDLERAELD